jgi:integrase
MARTIRETSLATRSARLRLAVQSKPYWRGLETGLHVGYRRRATGGSWIARRRRDDGTYREGKLGLADDLQEADGETVLNFSQAQVLARRWWLEEQRTDQGFSPARRGPYTVAQACDDYLEDYRRRGGRSVPVLGYAYASHVLPKLGQAQVARLTTPQLQDWHRTLAEQPARLRTRPGQPQKFAPYDVNDPEAVRVRRATANRVFTYLKAAFNLAWRAGLVPSDHAWRRVKPFRGVDAPVIQYLTIDEIARLLNACPGAFRDLVQVGLLTGCRYGELSRLTVADYNREVGSLIVRIGKGGKARHVTLSEQGRELIERLVAGRSHGERLLRRDDGSSWGKSDQMRPMKAAKAQAGLDEGVSFHVLRHTHASHLAMAAVPMAVIARQLGHADTRMTERHYAHLAQSYVAETIRKNLPRLIPPSKEPVVVPLRVGQGY